MKTPLDYETHEGYRVYMKTEGNLLLEGSAPLLSGRLKESLAQGSDGWTE
jgi:hypothetical protein